MQVIYEINTNLESHTHKYAGSSTVGGSATSAEKLDTARTIRTNLGSTSTASFDGSKNVTPGVTGTLPVANGGTNATTAADARNNLGFSVNSSARGTVSGQSNLAYLKYGNLVIISGRALLNGVSATITLPYAPITELSATTTGLNSSLETGSYYNGVCKCSKNSTSMTITLADANTWAAINFVYLTAS